MVIFFICSNLVKNIYRTFVFQAYGIFTNILRTKIRNTSLTANEISETVCSTLSIKTDKALTPRQGFKAYIYHCMMTTDSVCRYIWLCRAYRRRASPHVFWSWIVSYIFIDSRRASENRCKVKHFATKITVFHTYFHRNLDFFDIHSKIYRLLILFT